MTANELRKQIICIIKNSNLDETRFSVGVGETYDKNKKRFIYNFSSKQNDPKSKETIQYALKYFRGHGICLIWKTIQPTNDGRNVRRWNVSASANTVLECTGKGISKFVERRNGNAENAYLTTLEGLPKFFQKYGHLFQ